MIKKLTGFLLMFLTISCAENEYVLKIEQFRAMKNENFKKKESSPLTSLEIKKFKGLNYFEIQENYKLEAKFVKETFPKYIRLFNDEKVEEIHQLTGKILFKWNGKPIVLSAFTSLNQAPKKLFIPFKDLSSGTLTYGGGRYIEAELINDSTCYLDFNLAYQPFCAYNEEYSCPIPPAENFIQDSILAGEKLFLK